MPQKTLNRRESAQKRRNRAISASAVFSFIRNLTPAAYRGLVLIQIITEMGAVNCFQCSDMTYIETEIYSPDESATP